MFNCKATAEITSGSRVGYPIGANCVKIRIVISQPLYIFKAFAIAENVVSNIENMIRLKIRIVQLEKMKVAIDSFVQSQPPDLA